MKKTGKKSVRVKAKEDDQRLLQVWTKMGEWLMSHPGHAFGVFLTRNITTLTILLDHSIIDSEPCNLEDPIDKARAIEALLQRRER